MAEKEPAGGVQAVRRAVDILFAFTIERPILTAAEIAGIIGLHRTTVHRLLGTLEAAGLVRRFPDTSKYTLSSRVLQLAQVVQQVNTVPAVAQEPMIRLRDATGETVGLHLRDGMTRAVVAQVESHHEVRRTYPRLGEQIPLHRGAPGKAMLAFLPPRERDAYLDQLARDGGGAPPVDWAALERDLDRIADQGYALTRAERVAGVVAIAAPIRAHDGRVVASVNISGPEMRFTDAAIEQIVPAVVAAATEISRALGYAPGTFSR